MSGGQFICIVLHTHRRPQADQFSHRCSDAAVPNNSEEEPVDEPRRATILQAKDEDAEESFPGHHQGTREAENGERREIALNYVSESQDAL